MKAIYLIILVAAFTGCKAQTRSEVSPGKEIKVGGRCEDCDIMYEGMPQQIPSTDTSKGWYLPGEKFILTGTVFNPDGNPAKDVILYYWQTDISGRYVPDKEQPERSKRHGKIRGWIKTGKDGKYALYTIKPASYPNSTIPAHIHFLVKEPGLSEYYIDDIVFDGDPFLTGQGKPQNRGGSGFMKLSPDNIPQGIRNIFLGKNIPDYSRTAGN